MLNGNGQSFNGVLSWVSASIADLRCPRGLLMLRIFSHVAPLLCIGLLWLGFSSSAAAQTICPANTGNGQIMCTEGEAYVACLDQARQDEQVAAAYAYFGPSTCNRGYGAFVCLLDSKVFPGVTYYCSRTSFAFAGEKLCSAQTLGEPLSGATGTRSCKNGCEFAKKGDGSDANTGKYCEVPKIVEPQKNNCCSGSDAIAGSGGS